MSADLEIPVPPNSKLGRRVAAAFALLVLLNVLVGIAFIIGSKKKMPADLRGKEAAMREQLASSLKKAGENAMPPPALDVAEVRLIAPASEWERLANSVVLIAHECGGSAAKAPADASGLTVLANIPATRDAEFRRGLAPLGEVNLSSPPAATENRGVFGEKKNIYVRIAQAP
jgi:hypothetical protein